MDLPATPAPAAQKPTLLIIDDERGPRDALTMLLRHRFTILTAESASAALDVLNSQPIDLITLDQKLPDRQGLDLLQDIKQHHATVEVIIITGYGSLTSALEGIRHGASGYLLKPFNVTEVLSLVNQTINKKQRLDFLRNFLKTSTGLWGSETECAQDWNILFAGYQAIGTTASDQLSHTEERPNLLPILSDLLEAKDRQLLLHSSRVSAYATLVGSHLNLTRTEQQSLAWGAFLHDIGKISPDTPHPTGEAIAVAGEALGNPQHSEQGAKLMLSLGVAAEVGQIIAYHHERWDGSGHPYGLKEAGIPQLARIVCLAQAFDHLTEEHPGRTPLSLDEACQRLRAHAGTHFEPTLTELFVQAVQESKGSLPPMAITATPALRASH